jgi:hypothetical protein
VSNLAVAGQPAAAEAEAAIALITQAFPAHTRATLLDGHWRLFDHLSRQAAGRSDEDQLVAAIDLVERHVVSK